MPSKITQDTNSLRVRDVYVLNPATQNYISSGNTFVAGEKGIVSWLTGYNLLSSISIPTTSTTVISILEQVQPGLSSISTAAGQSLSTMSDFSNKIESTFTGYISTQVDYPLTSTVNGLGTAGYISTGTVELSNITVDRFSLVDTPFSSLFFTSSGEVFVNNSSLVINLSLQSTVQGLGTTGYLSSLEQSVANSNLSTVQSFTYKIDEYSTFIFQLPSAFHIQAIAGGSWGWTIAFDENNLFDTGIKTLYSKDLRTWINTGSGSLSTLGLISLNGLVSYPNTSTLIAGGQTDISFSQNDTVWITTDNGSNWASINSITSLYGVNDIQYFPSIDTTFVVGTNAGEFNGTAVYKVGNGSWTSLPSFSFSKSLTTISYNSNTGYFMAGGEWDGLSASNGAGFISQDGTTWTNLNVPNFSKMLSITNNQSNTWIASVLRKDLTSDIVKSTDNGSNWTSVLPLGFANNLNCKVFYDKSKYWAIGNGLPSGGVSSIQLSEDDGNTWSPKGLVDTFYATCMGIDPTENSTQPYLIGFSNSFADVPGTLYSTLTVAFENNSFDSNYPFLLSTLITVSSKTIFINATALFNNSTLQSSINGLGRTFVSSASLFSTTNGLGRAGYVSSFADYSLSTIRTIELDILNRLTVGWNISNTSSNSAVVRAFDSPFVATFYGSFDITQIPLTPYSDQVYSIWTNYSSNLAFNTSLLYQSSVFVVGVQDFGTSNSIQYSTDGSNWIATNSDILRTNSIKYGKGQWMVGGLVASGSNGAIQTSADGATFTRQTISTTDIIHVTAIEYNSTLDQWIALGSPTDGYTGVPFESLDNGSTWSTMLIDISGAANFSTFGIATNNTNLWVAVGTPSNELYSYTSANGKSWAKKGAVYSNLDPFIPFDSNLNLRQFLKYVPQNSSFYLLISSLVKKTTDGVTWTQCSVQPEFSWTNDILYDGHNYVMVGYTGVRVSEDGVNFVQTLSTLSSILTIPGFLTESYIPSTVAGLATAGYLSSYLLESTVAGLGTASYVSTLADLPSTVIGLGTADYVSTLADLPSTVNGLGTATYASTAVTNGDLTSTITGLGTAGYISSATLTSTVKGLGNTYVSSTQLTSTVGGLGQQYVSTSLAFSTYKFLVSSLETTFSTHVDVQLNSSIQLSTFTVNLSSYAQELVASSILNLEFLNAIQIYPSTVVSEEFKFVSRLQNDGTGNLFGEKIFTVSSNVSSFFLQRQIFTLTSNDLLSTTAFPSSLTLRHSISTGQNIQFLFTSLCGPSNLTWITLNNMNY